MWKVLSVLLVIYGLMHRQIEHWVIKQTSFFFFKRFIYFWLLLVFVAACGFSLVAVHELLIAEGFSLWNTGSRCVGFSRGAWASVMVHGFNCSMASAIFPEQVSNLCPLHWQVDSQPLGHQGSPRSRLLVFFKRYTSYLFGSNKLC